MKNFFRNHLYALIYLLVFLVIIGRIIFFEISFENDYKIKEGSICNITCKVTSLPSDTESGISFVAQCVKGADINHKILVQVKYGDDMDVSYGDTLTFRGRFILPDDAMNPGNFDYRSYLKSRDASWIVNTNKAEVTKHIRGKLSTIYHIRETVSKRFFRYLPYEEASLVNALVTGSKEEMSEERKESFRKAGVYHVIAVSGLHLNMLIVFLSALYANLKLKQKKKNLVSFAVTFAGCMFLLSFTGFGFSVERAVLMSLALCLATFVMREYSPFAGLFAVMTIILMGEPYAWRDVSFQLSFSATAGVLTAAEIIKKYKLSEKRFAFVTESLLITQCANLFTMPFVIYNFNAISVISSVSNLIIVSVIPLILFMSYIFGIAVLILPEAICNILSFAVTVPAYAVNVLTDIFASVPYGYITFSPKLFNALALTVIFGVLIIKLKSKRLRILLLMLFVFANYGYMSYNIKKRPCTVTFVNVGQGECSIVRSSGGATLMIDCGSESHEVCYNITLPYLRYENIGKIDALMVTHYHDDHVNGVTSLIKEGYVESLILPYRHAVKDEYTNASLILQAATKYGIPVTWIKDGSTLELDGIRVKILSSENPMSDDANENSVTALVTCGGKRILYTGDIAELSQYKVSTKDCKADIIKIPHHGARSTMSDTLSKASGAKYAIISCDRNNMYNHPHKETLEAYKDSKILRTDKNKMIKFTINDNLIYPCK